MHKLCCKYVYVLLAETTSSTFCCCCYPTSTVGLITHKHTAGQPTDKHTVYMRDTSNYKNYELSCYNFILHFMNIVFVGRIEIKQEQDRTFFKVKLYSEE